MVGKGMYDDWHNIHTLFTLAVQNLRYVDHFLRTLLILRRPSDELHFNRRQNIIACVYDKYEQDLVTDVRFHTGFTRTAT